MKLKIKELFDFGYESHIRLSLIFFILFLILLNFGTVFLFHQTQKVLKKELDQELFSAALYAKMAWEEIPQTNLRKSLMELIFKLNLTRITYLNSNGDLLISFEERLSGEVPHIFGGMKPEEIRKMKAKLKKEQTREFFSNFYSDENGKAFRSLYLPIESKRGLKELSSRNEIWVMVEKDVTAFSAIQKLSQLNTLARTAGLLVAALFTVFLIRSVLKPYRLMMRKAQEEKITPRLEKTSDEENVDAAVRIFEQVIAEMKKNEATLERLYAETNRKAKDLESYNEYILRSIRSGMIICDTEGKIIRFNKSAQKILGISENVALGKHYRTVLGQISTLPSLIEAALLEQKVCAVPEMDISKVSGENIWVGMSTSVVKDEQNKMLGVAVLLSDVTQIKRLQNEIAFKEKMAALGEMSSGLAHELRNSMGVILGLSKLLKRTERDQTSTDQTVDGILDEAMYMESLIQRFLTFAKPFDLKIEKVNLKRVVDECINPLKEKLKKSKIRFQVKSEPNLPTTFGDRILLKQCFQNLIQNSIESMSPGGRLSIDLRETKTYPEEKFLKIEISDTGCGIEEKNQEKIFNPFFTSKEKGTGLGLSLVKKIISLHNGEIELESQINKGTTFKIYLPLKLKPDFTEVEAEEKKNLSQFVYS
ncbi:MAG: nitrogen regulation protein NR(II) [Candidatus Zixiibacteriota bacterium]